MSNSNTDIALGVDIGGTNTAFGFVDKEGNLISSSTIPTIPTDPVDKFFKRLFSECESLLSKIGNRHNLVGIGVGAPNANYFKGTVEQPPNLKWGTVNVVEILKKHFSLPAAITNDANAAAIGEFQFGAAKGMKNFVVVTLGTGVGCGIFVNGELYYGNNGYAGELGHTIYDPNGRECGCGRKGCLETYVSAGGIKKTAFELLSDSSEKSELRDYKYENLTPKIISEAAHNGDKIAIKTYDFTSKILGIKLADLVAITNPEAIILFGGITSAGNILFNASEKYMNTYLLNIFRNTVKFIPSGLSGGSSAIVGAAALIWTELEKVKEVSV